MIKFNFVSSPLFLFLILLISCNEEKVNDEKFLIAISKASPVEKYQTYISWLQRADSTIEWVDLYSLGLDSARLVIENCDGLLLTGGEDIYPGLYGKMIDTALCDKPNRYRDSLEYTALETALLNQIPVMGICRGMQMINVYFGGTLYFDLPVMIGEETRHRYPGYKPAFHEVNITDNANYLNGLEGKTDKVYSNHHQGVELLATSLQPEAFSPDSLIEAISYADTTGKPFLLGVQWHPEKMDHTIPLSDEVAKLFIRCAKRKDMSRK